MMNKRNLYNQRDMINALYDDRNLRFEQCNKKEIIIFCDSVTGDIKYKSMITRFEYTFKLNVETDVLYRLIKEK